MESGGLDAFTTELDGRVAEEYRRLGYDQGWRLLYSPENVLQDARVAFIGLNPGGLGAGPEAHATLATPTGTSTYRDEEWKPPREPGEEKLQRQVLEVFRRLDVRPERVLAGNLVPFRSKDWERLG